MPGIHNSHYHHLLHHHRRHWFIRTSTAKSPVTISASDYLSVCLCLSLSALRLSLPFSFFLLPCMPLSLSLYLSPVHQIPLNSLITHFIHSITPHMMA